MIPVVVAAAVTGIVRIWYLAGPRVQFNADEATTGIMVREILQGRHFTFYAGQDYGGSLEQYLQAASYLVLPLSPTAFTLRLTQVALSMTTCVLVYLVAARVLSSKSRAGVAALLFAVSPWFNVIMGATSLGFYVAGQTLSTAMLYAALRSADAFRAGWWLLGTGLVAGLAMWTSLTSLYFLLPVFIWLLPVLRCDARRWSAVVLGFMLGALPLLAWVARHGRLGVPGVPAEQTTTADRIRNLFGPVIHEYVGVAYSHMQGGLWLPAQLVVVAALVAAYARALVRRSGLRAFVLLRVAERRPADLLLAIPPVVVVLYAGSSSAWYTGTPRYLFVTYPVLAVGLAALVPARDALRRGIATLSVVSLSVVLSFGFFHGPASELRTPKGDAVLRQVTEALVVEHQTRVYAAYWTAMPLQYVAEDRLVVGVCTGVRRFPDAQAAVRAAPAPAYIGSDYDGSAERILAALTGRHIGFRARRIGYVTIYDRLSSRVGPGDLGL